MTRHPLLLIWAFAFLAGGCSVLGRTSGGDEVGPGGVDRAFHKAYYEAQLAKIKGDRAGAKEAFLACLDRDPEAAVVHFELSRLEQEDAQWQAARAAVDRAVELDGEV